MSCFLKLAAVVLFTLFCQCTQAQSPNSHSGKDEEKILLLDTLPQNPSLPNSLDYKELQVLGSIQSKTYKLFDKLKHSYDSITSFADNASSKIQHRIDSLNQLNLPTNHQTSKLDSIAQWKDEKLKAVQTKVDELKSSVNEKIQSLAPIDIGVPDELTERSEQFTSLVDKYDVTLPNSSIPDLNVGNNLPLDLPKIDNPLSGQSLPDINNPLSGQQLPAAPEMNLPEANLPAVDIPSADINGVTDQISQYQNKITEVVPQNVEDVQALTEREASNYAQLGEVQKQMSEADQLADVGQLKNEKAVKEKLKEEVKKQAVNHFAGKEQQLQQAMEQMSKYKKKYESVQSLAELPKKQPKPLHDKPSIERLVPGIALQIHRKDALMVDFNPYVGYRFNEQLTAGLGWNQRVAYNFDLNAFHPELRIYGPRSYGEFKISEGLKARLEAEYMKTTVPPIFSSGKTDPEGKEWVFSTMAGIKKDYRFFKSVRGTAMVLYNLYDPHHRSPYADRLIMRFGFEFPMKKKQRKLETKV